MRYDSLTITSLVYICPVMQYYICSIVIIIEAICVVHSPKTQICSMFPIVAQKTKLLSPSDLCLQLLRCSKPLHTITAYNCLPQIIWNHENKDTIEIGKPSRRAGVINGTKRNLRNRPHEYQHRPNLNFTWSLV